MLKERDMIKRKRTGIWIMVALIILVSAGFIWLDNPVVRLVGQEEKLRISLVIVAICLGILLFDELLVRLWEWLVSLRFVQQLKMRAGVKPEQLEHEQHKCASGENVKEIRCYLRQRYGRRWATKIRILVLTGTVSEVEQLTPGLTSQLWQEDKGTLLLWGGDLNAPAETEWLKALRKLRYRPADGLVWVTSAFDRLSAPGLPTPSSAPSDSAMDTLAYAISQRMAESGWRLPLYLWSLHPRAAQSARQIAQAAGCLLPAGCSAEGLAQQLQMLSAQLIDQGILQICDSTQHNFLLTLADQLIREPESLSRPLSIMLNSYRPLPLAGIVFSSLSTEVQLRHLLLGQRRSRDTRDHRHHCGNVHLHNSVQAEASQRPGLWFTQHDFSNGCVTTFNWRIQNNSGFIFSGNSFAHNTILNGCQCAGSVTCSAQPFGVGRLFR
jgi:type VI secretion system protein ImpL